MKLFKSKNLWVFVTIILLIGYAVSCTKNDQILDNGPKTSANELLSIKTASPPLLDGIVESIWLDCPKLQFSTAVPETTGDVFRGYTGNIIPSVTLRSTYDDSTIYFLVEWNDPTESILRQPWYFDPSTKQWAQESGAPTFNASGTITRPAFYEDKVAFLFNINNSVLGWNSGTCYKSCHTGLPSTDGSSRHFTNFGTERIDMWHWKSVRGGINGTYQVHDQYQDNIYPNGRHGDPGADVYSNNTQKLTVIGSPNSASVSVPLWVIPNKNDNKWILISETSSGAAKKVTAVDTNGILTLSDGSTINPNIGTDYQRIATGNLLGTKVIAGLLINDAGYVGSTGDISCRALHNAAGWTLELKRALKTTDPDHDIDFSGLTNQYFGFAIFENAQIAHSIKTNLLLKFEK